MNNISTTEFKDELKSSWRKNEFNSFDIFDVLSSMFYFSFSGYSFKASLVGGEYKLITFY